MIFTAGSRARWTTSLAAVLASALLGACAGTFSFQVQSSAPAEVGSVYVLFGDDTEFEGKESASVTEKVGLVQRAKLESYAGYAEYELVVEEGAARWNKLSERRPDEIELEISEDAPGVMKFSLARGLLDLHPNLGVAVVVRTAKSAYHVKSWPRAYVAEAEGKLVVDVTGAGISAELE